MQTIFLPSVHRGAQQKLLHLHGPFHTSHRDMRRPGGALLSHRHDGDQPQIRQGILHETGAGSSPGTAIATSVQPKPVSTRALMDQVSAHQTYVK